MSIFSKKKILLLNLTTCHNLDFHASSFLFSHMKENGNQSLYIRNSFSFIHFQFDFYQQFPFYASICFPIFPPVVNSSQFADASMFTIQVDQIVFFYSINNLQRITVENHFDAQISTSLKLHFIIIIKSNQIKNHLQKKIYTCR